MPRLRLPYDVENRDGFGTHDVENGASLNNDIFAARETERGNERRALRRVAHRPFIRHNGKVMAGRRANQSRYSRDITRIEVTVDCSI